jgi:hypothetical protein
VSVSVARVGRAPTCTYLLRFPPGSFNTDIASRVTAKIIHGDRIAANAFSRPFGRRSELARLPCRFDNHIKLHDADPGLSFRRPSMPLARTVLALRHAWRGPPSGRFCSPTGRFLPGCRSWLRPRHPEVRGARDEIAGPRTRPLYEFVCENGSRTILVPRPVIRPASRVQGRVNARLRGWNDSC